ncbi:hypothetical protein QUB64_28435, partial [Microcoleus sp. Aus8_D2]
MNPQIRQKTRFLRVAALKSSTGGQKPGFFAKIWVWPDRFGKKPGFSESQPLNPVQAARNRVF